MIKEMNRACKFIWVRITSWTTETFSLLQYAARQGCVLEMITNLRKMIGKDWQNIYSCCSISGEGISTALTMVIYHHNDDVNDNGNWQIHWQ